MKNFKCGTIVVDKSEWPNWREVAARLSLMQEMCRGVSFKFMRASSGREGGWEVPFIAFEFDPVQGPGDRAEAVLRRWCPYELSNMTDLHASSIPASKFASLRDLAKGGSAPVTVRDLIGRSTEAARPDAADKVFDGLVGMDEQKLTLMKLSTAVAKHGHSAVDCLHFVFEGNPGTGKTELASRFVSYLDCLGVTDGTNKMIRTSGNALVARYVGQTSDRVKKIVDSARGGLLFIDEFYALSQSGGEYGQEAIDTLTERLDLCRHDLVCVISGYPKQVQRTLELNPGLSDRFGYRLSFPDYTVSQLVSIFLGMAVDRGFGVTCIDELGPAMARLRSSKGFSNARSVRKLVDHAVVEASWDHDEPVINAADLKSALASCLSTPAQSRVGF